MFCVHQPKRTGANRGQTIGMDDMANAGETEATYVLGVYRKREDEWLEMDERRRMWNTVSVNISKNKRPPCKVGSFDFHLEERTGLIREMTDEDRWTAGLPIRSAQEAIAAREWQRTHTPEEIA
jgi:hypothetical protein